jgi:hypothetical protein
VVSRKKRKSLKPEGICTAELSFSWQLTRKIRFCSRITSYNKQDRRNVTRTEFRYFTNAVRNKLQKVWTFFRFIPGISHVVACFYQITVFGNESHAKSGRRNIFCCITELDIRILIIYALYKCGNICCLQSA